MESVKETKEVLVALNMLSLVLIKIMKDGVQASDAAALVAEISSNEELKLALFQAYDNVKKVLDEMKDVSLSEGVELAMVQIQFVPQIIDALKKSA